MYSHNARVCGGGGGGGGGVGFHMKEAGMLAGKFVLNRPIKRYLGGEKIADILRDSKGETTTIPALS